MPMGPKLKRAAEAIVSILGVLIDIDIDGPSRRSFYIQDPLRPNQANTGQHRAFLGQYRTF